MIPGQRAGGRGGDRIFASKERTLSWVSGCNTDATFYAPACGRLAGENPPECATIKKNEGAHTTFQFPPSAASRVDKT